MKFLGVVILGVGVGGTPPQKFFGQKCYFSHISQIFEVMGLKIIRGSVPPSPRVAMPPLIFLRSKLGLARYIHRHFAMVGLRCFRPLTLALWRVPSMQVPIRPFRHFCCSVYRLAIKHTEKNESKKPSVCRVQLSLLTVF